MYVKLSVWMLKLKMIVVGKLLLKCQYVSLPIEC